MTNTIGGMSVGVCGLLCERCIKFNKKQCSGCAPNKVCKMPGCAMGKDHKLCFECRDFPCKKCETLFQRQWLEFIGSEKVVG